MAKLGVKDKSKIATKFMQVIPFSAELAMSLDFIENGKAIISMPYDSRFIGDPHTGIIHGGAVSSLLDTCGGAAVMSHPSVPAITSTLDFRIDYMRSATPNQRITAKAECYHVHDQLHLLERLPLMKMKVGRLLRRLVHLRLNQRETLNDN